MAKTSKKKVVSESEEITKLIYEAIGGKDISSAMVAMSMVIGKIGACLFEEDKDVFMERLINSVSDSYDFFEDYYHG